jgi:RNA polymerase sigma-70 factor (ECF subfamily)
MMKSDIGKVINSRQSNMNDEKETVEIIMRIKRGEEGAFADLVNRYRRQVAAAAYRIVGDYDDAADITQMVFMKTSQNIDKYDENRRFYTWLYRITINASIDYLRKHRRHKHEQLDVVGSNDGSDRGNPERNIRADRLREHIRDAAEKLNRRQKAAFILRDIEGHDVIDVAGIMNMPEATVRWYLHRARSRIRKELIRKCPHLLRAVGII